MLCNTRGFSDPQIPQVIMDVLQHSISDLEEIFSRGIISFLTGVALVLWHNHSAMESFWIYKVLPKQCFLNSHFHLGKGILTT